MTTPSSAAKALIEAALVWAEKARMMGEQDFEALRDWFGREYPGMPFPAYRPNLGDDLIAAIDTYRALDPDGSILVRQAEIGEAVERLPKDELYHVLTQRLADQRDAARADAERLAEALDHTITHTEHYECDFVWCVDARAVLAAHEALGEPAR
jgi:hypothetical protein